MRKLTKSVSAILLFACVLAPLSAQGTSRVLATNAWTAAFVKLAGAEAVQLAPSEMNHPPEYELKPSDVKKIKDADLLVYAGYEVLMKTVFDSFNKPADQLVRIGTSYAPAVVESSVLAIADRLGTTAGAKAGLREYRETIASSRKQLEAAGLFGAPVLVQFHQKPLAEALGFEILGVFGPQPLEARQIADFGRMSPTLIIDNIHSPQAAPLGEILGVGIVSLVNFPGYTDADGSRAPDTLAGVVRENTARLLRR